MQFGIASAQSYVGRALGGPAALAPVYVPRPDDFWRIYGLDDFYSCIPDAALPVDPGIMKALHSFAPGAIHITVKERWLPPHARDPILVRYHAIGFYLKTAFSWHPRFWVEMPAKPTHPVPNVIDYVMKGDDRPDGGPATYEPFDWGMLARLRRNFNEHRTAKDMGNILKAQYERRLAHRQKMAEERERFERHLAHWLYLRLEGKSDVEWAEYYRGLGKRKRDPKPYVFLGGKGQ